MKNGMIDPEFLALLRCPETGQPLNIASAEQLARIEAARVAGVLRDRAGNNVGELVLSGLVRADGQLLFPIRDGLPILLLDEAVPLGAR